jgi:enamine deaminase RidA (YjgF/YER057c/UK114 family)
MASKTERVLVSSGSPMEPVIGFSRAVRAGNLVFVSGTAPIAAAGGVATPGDMKGQTRRCLEIIEKALNDAGAEMRNVVRTRVFVSDISRWKEAAEAHGEAFKDIRPATTFAEAKLIDPVWLVEIEADAVIG